MLHDAEECQRKLRLGFRSDSLSLVLLLDPPLVCHFFFVARIRTTQKIIIL